MLPHSWQKKTLIIMVVSVFMVIILPFLLCVFFPSISSEITAITEVREVRICFGFLLEVCLLVYTFSSEKVETNRTQRMRFRAASFVMVILGLAFLTLSILSLFGLESLYFSLVNAGYEYGTSGLIFFAALIVYNIVFKILKMSNLD